MCTVSAIYDYGRNQMDPNSWDRQQLEAFRKLVKTAMEFDKISGQPDCEDPKKKEWIEVVEKKVAADHNNSTDN